MPRVSVVTALYNHETFLVERARSVLNQSMRDFEWIIVDDCSSDDGYEKMAHLTRHDDRVRLMRNASNQGFTRTVQRGLDEASGQFIYLADSDDSCDLRFLEVMSGLMQDNPAVGFAHCRGLRMDARNGIWGGIPKQKGRYINAPDAFPELVMNYTIRQPTLLFRHDAIKAVGGFARLPLKGNSDWYLVLRVALIADVIFCPEPLGYHRTHGSNMSSSPTNGVENFMLLEDIFNHLPPPLRHFESLRRPAYRAAAAKLLAGIDTLRKAGRQREYQEALDIARRYVPDANPARDGRGAQIVRALAYRVAKLLTYRPVEGRAGR